MASSLLTEQLSAPLDGATTARIDIQAEDGNLTIDRLAGGEPLLASGTLQYFESQGPPECDVVSTGGRAALTLKGRPSKQVWLRLPWVTANAATEWHIHLNPAVSSDITARSGGGNVRLDLAGMAVSSVSADTGAGNMDVVLPDNSASMNVTARSGAGKVNIELGRDATGNSRINADSGAGDVVIRLPGGVAARVRATTGMGKVIVDPHFARIDKNTYQSPGFESAANRVEVTANSGMGNVIVNTR